MVSIEQAGHFQFLDKQSSMQRAVCAQGKFLTTLYGKYHRSAWVSDAVIVLRSKPAHELNAMQLAVIALLC